MEQVGFATLYQKPKKLDINTATPSGIWVGNAIADGGDTRLYLKSLPPEQMLAECLAAILANEIGMSSPRPFFVIDPHGFMGGDILFGSEDAGAPSLKRWILELQDQAVLQKVESAPWYPLLAVFDEWIANPDRNFGNLLWSSDGNWYPIDHAFALWAPYAAPDATLKVTNLIATRILQLEKDIGLQKLKNHATPIGQIGSRLDQSEIGNAIPVNQIGMTERCQNTIMSLLERITLLPKLLASRSNQPDMLP